MVASFFYLENGVFNTSRNFLGLLQMLKLSFISIILKFVQRIFIGNFFFWMIYIRIIVILVLKDKRVICNLLILFFYDKRIYIPVFKLNLFFISLIF